MSHQAGMRHLLALVYGAGPVKKRKPAKTKAARTPKPPTRAELAYVAALRKMTKQLGAAVRETIGPVVARAAAPDVRTDAAGDTVVGAALDQLRERMAEIVESAISAGIIEAAFDTVNSHNLGEMSRVLGIAPEALSPELATAMAGFRSENVALIRSIAEDYLGEVERYVTTATTEGIRAEELSRALVERFGVAQSRAELIAVDQILKANAQLSQERMTRVGIVEYEWSTSGDSRVREGHKALDGSIQRWDSPPVVDPKTGRRAHPGRDYRCRCVALPRFADDDE